eukprot:CAMPEP_0206601840 /NCGR_PEP_ID=MMETSP0325_2-20121206/46910_1 /ASSEMBLY_ACC=CAM_ASM_000347 /TAXON_ID=2866 /ORGANISM="Crypthecodinium cohnii, Strain Seligo" /LENGTH=130 /DNA_ID=CAMNT_0054113971 /DNA_START=30 /DNA_END=422 /DNA_ORIENTATION=+
MDDLQAWLEGMSLHALGPGGSRVGAALLPEPLSGKQTANVKKQTSQRAHFLEAKPSIEITSRVTKNKSVLSTTYQDMHFPNALTLMRVVHAIIKLGDGGSNFVGLVGWRNVSKSNINAIATAAEQGQQQQ